MKALALALFLLTPSLAFSETAHFSFGAGAQNTVKIEIPAPLETTRAQLSGVRGVLDVDLGDLTKTAGVIEADLSGIKSSSFSDQDKNDTQTEHMRNWFGLGEDMPAAQREKNQWARFTITKVTKADPSNFSKAPTFSDALGTGRKFRIMANGDFTVHGITKSKVVELEASVFDVKSEGAYQGAQRVLMLKTVKPFIVSLKEHDVKPRDTTGKFLSTALKVVGLKLSDDAQVSLDLRAIQGKSQ